MDLTPFPPISLTPFPGVVVRRRTQGEKVAVAGDLCVVGSGAAGASAAIEAARLGRRVVLLDGAPGVGGQATGAIIDTFCGFFSNGPQPELLTYGIAEEIVRDLTRTDAMDRIEGRRNTLILYYRHTALQRWLEDALTAAGVTVITGALLTRVEFDGARIAAVGAMTRHGEVEVRARAYVDASGDATPLDPVGAARMVIDGHRQLDQAFAFLQAEFPAVFGAAFVDRYGQPGVRQTRWIKGRYQLAAADVRGGVRFDDRVARCAWGIELHNSPSDVHWEGFPDGHVHYVPYRSMVHAECDNLLAAGRCIDADVLALASVRVMGPCIAMGAAAAHAIDLAGDAPLGEVDIGALRGRLARNLGED